MARKRQRGADGKAAALRQHGVLNPHPDTVTDPAFQEDEFFDPRDLVQVKYEMVRRVRKEGGAVTQVAKTFGVSRPTFYQAQASLEREGLPGLVPKKRGPRGGHKVTPAVVRFIQGELDKTPSLGTEELLQRLRDQCGVGMHRRTLERAVIRLKKKPPRTTQRR